MHACAYMRKSAHRNAVMLLTQQLNGNACTSWKNAIKNDQGSDEHAAQLEFREMKREWPQHRAYTFDLDRSEPKTFSYPRSVKCPSVGLNI